MKYYAIFGKYTNKENKMSRIGKNPIPISSAINVTIQDKNIKIKGPKGELEHKLSPQIYIEQNINNLVVHRRNDSKTAKQLHGLHRTLINNIVLGVSQGFCKILEIQGVGYKAQIDKNQQLTLHLGYSHPIIINQPNDIYFEVDNNNIIKIHGINKETVGQVAAQIRSMRPPEPYKCKGIKYKNEIIRKKIGKAGK